MCTRKFLFTVDYIEYGQVRHNKQYLIEGKNLDIAKQKLIEQLKAKGVKSEFIDILGCSEQI